MISKSALRSIGLPHSGHSGGVSGRVLSSMVLSTSTNGTSAMMPRNRLGRHVGDDAHQHAAGRAAVGDDAARCVSPPATRYSPAAMKSVKVLIFFSSLPSVYQR